MSTAATKPTGPEGDARRAVQIRNAVWDMTECGAYTGFAGPTGAVRARRDLVALVRPSGLGPDDPSTARAHDAWVSACRANPVREGALASRALPVPRLVPLSGTTELSTPSPEDEIVNRPTHEQQSAPVVGQLTDEPAEPLLAAREVAAVWEGISGAAVGRGLVGADRRHEALRRPQRRPELPPPGGPAQ